MKFAQQLKNAMTQRNVKQLELSRMTGIGKSSISQYVAGKNIPGRNHMARIVHALQVSEDYLMGKSQEPITPGVINKRNLTPAEAAKLLGKSVEFVRVGLQRGILPFGCAVKIKTRYTYHISLEKLIEYAGQHIMEGFNNDDGRL